MRRLVFVLAVILVVVVVVVRLVGTRAIEDRPVGAPPAKSVEAVVAKRSEIRAELRLSGTIQPESRILIVPEVAGKIVSIAVDEGSSVAAGDVLAVVDHESLEFHVREAEASYSAAKTAHEQAQVLAEVRVRAQIAQARAGHRAAKASLSQMRDLAEIRTVSQLDQSVAGLEGLQATLDKIRSGAREEDRRQATANVEQAAASLANTRANHDRMERLYEVGAVTRQSYDASATQLDIAVAQHNIAHEQLRLIETGAREEDVRAVEAQVRQAQAALRLARAQADTHSWQKDIALAESRLEEAKAALGSAEALETARSWEADITTATAAMDRARAGLDLARKRVRDATIRAPVSGTIAKRYLDLGGTASPTMPLFELVAIDTVRATASVLESDLGTFSLGDKADVRVAPIKETISGTVTSIGPSLDPASRSARVEVTVPNRDRRLRPGMFAIVTIPLDVRSDAIVIPTAAVIIDESAGGPAVVVIEDGVGWRRRVELGLEDGDVVQIAAGISEGDRVLVSGQHTVRDGESVELIER